jgi:ubiquinone/menaquinone biosynthesis C-methylase UbiE
MSVMSNIEAAFCRSAPWRSFARRIALPWALQGTALGVDVLEIGGGSGAMASALLRRHPGTRLTVTDVDDRMVRGASRRLASFGERAQVVVADATELEFEDESFDMVCSWLMLHHTMRWERVCAEAVRVLRPDGLFVGYDLTDSRPARFIHRIDGSEHRLIRPAELADELQQLEVMAPQVRTARGGLVFRFSATKATPSVPTP